VPESVIKFAIKAYKEAHVQVEAEFDKHKAEVEITLATVEESLSKVTEERDLLTNTVEELSGELSKLKEEMEKSNSELTAVADSRAKLTTQLAVFEERIESLTTALKEAKESHSLSLKEEVERAEKQELYLLNQIDEWKSQLKSKERESEKDKKHWDSERKELKEALQAKVAECSDLSKSVSLNEKQVTKLESDKDSLLKINEVLEDSVAGQKVTILGQADELQNNKSENDVLKKHNLALQKEIKQLKNRRLSSCENGHIVDEELNAGFNGKCLCGAAIISKKSN